jgi:L-2-hydroxycarboxylate dehydrogenase (NAD+)
MSRFAVHDLEDFGRRILEAVGFTTDAASTIARCLVTANLRGLESHGVLRLIQYADTIAKGEVNPRPEVRVERREGCTALVDADGGYGFVPMFAAMDLAIELARVNGLALVGVRNSHHFGMAGLYAEQAAKAGMIGIVMTNTGPVMAPAGVLQPLVGNNPLAFAIPRRPPAPPILLDMALSQTAFGRVRLAAAEGRSIPLGWAYNSEGNPTTDSKEALSAALLAPMGGHKGYGLALVVDVLAGILTGSMFGLGADAHGHRNGGVGHLAIAVSPSLFITEAQFGDSVESLVQQLKSAPVAEAGTEVVLPGDPEWKTADERAALGIPVSDELVGQLSSLAAGLGVEPLVVPAAGTPARYGGGTAD